MSTFCTSTLFESARPSADPDLAVSIVNFCLPQISGHQQSICNRLVRPIYPAPTPTYTSTLPMSVHRSSRQRPPTAKPYVTKSVIQWNKLAKHLLAIDEMMIDMDERSRSLETHPCIRHAYYTTSHELMAIFDRTHYNQQCLMNPKSTTTFSPRYTNNPEPFSSTEHCLETFDELRKCSSVTKRLIDKTAAESLAAPRYLLPAYDVLLKELCEINTEKRQKLQERLSLAQEMTKQDHTSLSTPTTPRRSTVPAITGSSESLDTQAGHSEDTNSLVIAPSSWCGSIYDPPSHLTPVPSVLVARLADDKPSDVTQSQQFPDITDQWSEHFQDFFDYLRHEHGVSSMMTAPPEIQPSRASSPFVTLSDNTYATATIDGSTEGMTHPAKEAWFLSQWSRTDEKDRTEEANTYAKSIMIKNGIEAGEGARQEETMLDFGASSSKPYLYQTVHLLIRSFDLLDTFSSAVLLASRL